MDAQRLAEFLPPLGSVDSLQRIAGDQWILTIAGDLVVTELRDAGEVLRFAVSNLLSEGRLSTTTLTDIRLSYDRITHRWALAGMADPGKESAALLVAVSTTADPTGQWLVSEIRPTIEVASWSASPSIALSGGVLTVSTSSVDHAPLTSDRNIEESFSFSETGLARFTTSGVNAPTISMSVSPGTGTGTAVPFFLSFSDPLGTADLSNVNLLINSTLNGVNSCFVTYLRASNRIGLLNDAGGGYSYTTPNSSNVVQNSQCSLSGNSYFYVNGNTVYGYVYVTFLPAFSGTKALYLSATAASAGFTGWSVGGAWAVPSSNLPPSVTSVTPSSGTNTVQSFVVSATDPNGVSDISTMSLLFNSALSGYNACFVMFLPGSNQIQLLSDSGATWSVGTIGGSSGLLQNNQCTLNPATSIARVSLDGTNWTFTASITFKPAFAGGKTIYAMAGDVAGTTSGWQVKGTWVVNSTDQAPNNVTVSPTTGLGVSGQFSFYASDPDGSADVSTIQALISNTLNGANACSLTYNFATNTVALYNDAGTTTSTAVLGSATVLTNSQCSLNVASAYVTRVSTTAGVYGIVISFVAPGFVGSKEVWVNVTDLENASSGWVAAGTWGIPTNSVPPFSSSLSPTSGSGASQIFQAQFSDVNGAARINVASLLVSPALNGVGACFVTYFPATNTIGLLNDAGSGYASLAAGTNTTTQNSQCTLNAAGSGGLINPFAQTTLVVNYSVTFFSGAFSGPKNVYLWSQDTNALTSGWSSLGLWTVP